MSRAVGGVIGFLSLAALAFAITIIALVASELWPGAGYYTGCVIDPATGQEVCDTYYLDGFCLMSNNSVNICRYSYSVGVIGGFVSIIMCCAMCLPAMLTLLLGLFNTIWWLGYAITVTVYTDNVNNQSVTIAGVTVDYGFPRNNYRVMCIALAWTSFCVCFVSTALAVVMLKNKPAGKAGKDMDEHVAAVLPPGAAV